MSDVAATLRRQLADHERAAEELRNILAELEPSARAEPSNSADAVAMMITELLEQCEQHGFPVELFGGAYFVRERYATRLVTIHLADKLKRTSLKKRRLNTDLLPIIPFKTIHDVTRYDLRDIAAFILATEH